LIGKLAVNGRLVHIAIAGPHRRERNVSIAKVHALGTLVVNVKLLKVDESKLAWRFGLVDGLMNANVVRILSCTGQGLIDRGIRRPTQILRSLGKKCKGQANKPRPNNSCTNGSAYAPGAKACNSRAYKAQRS
jgi:hypothetical protein